MKVDVLGQVLRAIRLRGSVYFNACFCSPWGVSLELNGRASFHIIVKGNAWLKMEGLDVPMELHAGDIVLFPKGKPHTVSDSPTSECLNADEVVNAYQNEQPLFLGELDDLNIICGYVEFDRTISHPFIDHLPELIHISAQMRQEFYWLDNIIKQIVVESRDKNPASELLIDKFTEILFVQLIRAYAKQNSTELGYVLALEDNQLSQALALLHKSPEKEWSVEEIARQVGMSRSVFYNRFNETVGTPPMKYLTQWRMMHAKEQLENTKTPIAVIAEQVGYQSDSAFQKAFKRFFSYTPAALRGKSKGNK